MSWLKRRRPKKPLSLPREELKLVSYNELLKQLDREGKLEAYVAAWIAFEREREGKP